MQKINLMVLRKIGKMKLRMVGISFVVAMAVSMLIAGLYSADVFDYSTETMLEESKMPDIFIELSEPANQSKLETTLSDQGLKIYDMRLKIMAFYTHEGEVYPAFIVGMEDPGRQDINVMTVDSGELFKKPGEGVVIAGMEPYGADTGEQGTFTISGKEVKINITGVVKNAEYALAGYMGETSVPVPGKVVALYMGLADLQAMLNVSGVNDLVLMIESGQDEDEIVDSLEEFNVKSVTLQKDHFTVIFMQMGVDKMNYMMPMFSVIFMIVGFISIMMTSYRLVLNDSRFIGVLMSLGYSRGKIIRAYLWLGMVLSIIGLIFGTLLGLLFTSGIVGATAGFIGSFDLAYPISFMPFILGAIYTFGTVLISVVIPVILITRVTVREALDYKPRSKITTLKIGPSFLSRTTLMGVRNISRNPARLAITVLVVGMTIGIAGSWLVMTDSAWGYIKDNVDSQTWDMRADFFEPVAEEEVNDIAPFFRNDTDYVIPYTGISGSVSFKGSSSGALFLGCKDIQRVRDFQVMEGKVDLSKAVLSNTLADELKVGVGDKVSLEVGSITKELKVSAIINDVVQSAVYTNQDTLAPFFSPENCTGIYIKMDDADLTEDYAAQLRLNPSITKVSIKAQVVQSFDDLLEQANVIFYMFFYISLFITFVVSGSTVIISTMERDIEFATLNTLGISKWQVAKSLMVEMVIFGVLSAIVGVPLAYLFAEIFAIVMAKILFTFPVIFILGATIITFITGVAFVLLSSFVPIRYSRKVDTEKTLRERTAG